MKGYIAVVRRHNDEYRAEMIDLPACAVLAPTVEEALHGAQGALRRWAAEGRALPAPRPSYDTIREGERRSAIAAACLRHYGVR